MSNGIASNIVLGPGAAAKRSATANRSTRLLTRSDVARLLRLPECIDADLPKAISGSDICITCTPSRRFIVDRDCVPPGASQDGKARRKRSFSIQAGLRWEMSLPRPWCTSGQSSSAVVRPSA